MHENKSCMLIEVMIDGPYLVFQCQSQREIQCNQHGNAHRKAAPTYTVHCLNEHKNDLHPVLKELLPEQEHSSLLESLIQAIK